jgi:hypothetical protein
VVADGETVTKSLAAGAGSSFVSGRRVRLASLPLYPGESPLNGKSIDWIEVEYPPASVRMFGITTHWLVWFSIFSMVTALLFKNKFKVVI